MTRSFACLAVTGVFLACGSDPGASQPDASLPDASPFDASLPASDDPQSYVPPSWQVAAPARLIVLGDSISAGLVASTGDLSYGSLLGNNDDDQWPQMQGLDLATLGGGEFDTINVAVSGAVTEDVLSKQLPMLATAAPYQGHSVVVVTVGGNDIAVFLASSDLSTIVNESEAEIQRVAENVGQIFDWFNPERFPDGVSFIAANVYDPTDGTAEGGVGDTQCVDLAGFAPLLVELFDTGRAEYRAVAEERGFAMADMYGYFLGHGFKFDDTNNPNYDESDPSLWFGDCVHPNDRGHHELRRLFYSVIDQDYRL